MLRAVARPCERLGFLPVPASVGSEAPELLDRRRRSSRFELSARLAASSAVRAFGGWLLSFGS